MAEWRYKIQTNIEEVVSQLRDLQNKVDKLENGEHQIKLDIDSKKLERVITNLDKMLESLGKGTGDFKEFENLSKQLTNIISEVQTLNKSLGGVNDKGISNLLSSISNIDRTLSSLSEHIINVNKDFGKIGDEAGNNVGQINKVADATNGLADATNKLNNAQKNAGNKSNSPVINPKNNIDEILKIDEIISKVSEHAKSLTGKDNLIFDNRLNKLKDIFKNQDILKEFNKYALQTVNYDSLREMVNILNECKDNMLSVEDISQRFSSIVSSQFTATIPEFTKFDDTIFRMLETIKEFGASTNTYQSSGKDLFSWIKENGTDAQKTLFRVTDSYEEFQRVLRGLSIGKEGIFNYSTSLNLDTLTFDISSIDNILSKENELENESNIAQKELSELRSILINTFNISPESDGTLTVTLKQLQEIIEQYPKAKQYIDEINSLISNKSNISSVDSEAENIKKQQQYYKNIADELVDIQDRHEGTRLIISEIGKSESEVISTIIQENKEIAAGNELWKERQFYIDEYGKVTASYRGDKNEIGIGNAENISIGNPVKETHIHPYNEKGAGSYSIDDVYNMHLAFLQGIRQFEFRWRDEVLSIDLSNVDPKSLLSMADSYEDFCAGVQKVMYDVYQIDQDFVFNRGQNLKNSYLANLIQNRGGSAKLYTQNFDGTKIQKDFLEISNAEQTLISTTGLYAIKLSELNEESEEYQRTAQYILNNRKNLAEYYQKMGLITSPDIDNDSLKNQIKLIDEFTIAFNEYISAYEDYYGRMNPDGDGFGLSKAEKTLSELEKLYPELKEIRSNGYVNYPDSELYDKALKKYLNRQEQLQSRLKETQNQAEDTAESILKVTGYRGTNGGDPVTSNKSGFTFWDSKKNVAGLYGTNSSDKTLWSSELSFKNPLTIDAKNQKYGDITYLGDGIDETSKKIIELTNREKELRTSLQNSTESGQEQVNMALELQKVIREISDISKNMSNPYGTHSTDWFAEYAKQNGYDGVHLKNVLDTPDSYAKDNTEISDVFITFQREQLENTTLLAKANKELAESEREVALAELGVVKNSDLQIKNPFQSNVESSPATSASAITEESNALEKVSSSATEAANAKEKFSEANKEVKSSADASVPSVEKESNVLDNVSKRSRSDSDNVKLEQRARIYKELNICLDRYAIVAGRVANEKTLSTDEEEMARLQVRIEELQNEPILSETQLELSRAKLEKIETSLENIQEKVQLNKLDTIQTSIDSYSKDYKRRNDGKPIEENRNKEYQQLLDQYKASIDALQAKKDELAKQPTISDADRESVRQMTDAIEENKNALIAMSAAEKGSTEGSRRKEIDKITKYLKDNTRISEEAKTKLKQYLDLLRSGDASVNVEKIHNGFLKVTEAERLAGNEGKRFVDIIRDKAVYGLAAQIASYYLSIMDMVRYARNAINAVRELDTALIDLKKTTTMNDSELETFYYDANDVAKQMGVTTAEIINQASAWSRFNKIDPLYGDI